MIPEMETHEPPDLLKPRRFNFDNSPPRPLPVFNLGAQVISTVGNLTNIQALPKAGKSAVLSAMIAAVMNGNRQGPDTLGFAAENSEGKALVHFDTEQSAFDHDQLVRRALKRAKVGEPPPWLMSYCVTDLTIPERKQALGDALQRATREHGGVFAVLIDGIADLSISPNDDAESFALVGNLHALAMEHLCAIVTILHENPGSDSGKTRGHLGSQLERKAETNLRLAKDAHGITSIWAERARHCHLPKEQAVCFKWSDSAGMHVSCGDAREIRGAANRVKMEAEAHQSFGGEDALKHGALRDSIGESLALQERASKKRIQLWTAEGVITKDSQGFYRLTA
jgi:hypothetical protein